MYLKQQEYQDALTDLMPISEAAAHPPLGALLFRYWTDESQSKLVNGTFWSGRATNIAAPPIPPVGSEYFPWDAVFSHFNRDKIATPFISTSNFFLWIARLAAKEAARGVRNGRITVINAARLNRRNIFHVLPFQRELCKKRPFENGALNYHGSHEVRVTALRELKVTNLGL